MVCITVLVVTQARVVCLICMPEARGVQAQGLRVDISGRRRVPVFGYWYRLLSAIKYRLIEKSANSVVSASLTIIM